jgi:Lon protease-like protein
MLILVEGSRRFKLNNVLTGKPYYVGEIEYFQDEPEEDVGPLAEECIALLERVVEAATEGSVGIEIEPPYRNLSFAIAGRVEFEPEIRQQILELTSEQERLQKVKELLGAAAERLERERQTREKAQTNGYLRGDWQPGT